MIQDLLDRLKMLNKNEKIHIFYLFKRYNVNYTQNSNGIFINLEHVSNDTLTKIINCINIIEEKRDLISELDSKRNMYIEYYKNLMNVKMSEIEYKKQCEINTMLSIEEDDYNIVKIETVEDDNDDEKTSLEYFKNYKVYESKNYHKDSVYFRLSQRMQSISKNYKNTYNYRYKPNDSSDLTSTVSSIELVLES
jgi:hypothetical protein